MTNPALCACLDCSWLGIAAELSAQACPKCDGRVCDQGSPEFTERLRKRERRMDDEVRRGIVEDVGHVQWTVPDRNWDKDAMPVARVRLDGDRYAHHYILPGDCFRNGTTLSAEIIGKTCEVHFRGAHIVGFSCPRPIGRAR